MRTCLHLVPLLALLAAPEAGAQSALRASEEQLVNYAFATELGSGVYDISGRTLQIYRMPFSYSWSQPEGNRPGMRFTLPVTVGLVDFEPRDVLDTGLPESLDTLSFVPGIEFDFELNPRWHLLPFAELGRSWDLGGDADATVYSIGAHATAQWRESSFDLRFDLGATYTGVEPDAPVRSDDLLLIEIGIEARRALTTTLAGRPLDWGVYALAQGFADRAEEPLDNASAAADPWQFEIGVTVGTPARLTAWQIPVPRIGVGYRFGEDLDVWRLVLGSGF